MDPFRVNITALTKRLESRGFLSQGDQTLTRDEWESLWIMGFSKQELTVIEQLVDIPWNTVQSTARLVSEKGENGADLVLTNQDAEMINPDNAGKAEPSLYHRFNVLPPLPPAHPVGLDKMPDETLFTRRYRPNLTDIQVTPQSIESNSDARGQLVTNNLGNAAPLVIDGEKVDLLGHIDVNTSAESIKLKILEAYPTPEDRAKCKAYYTIGSGYTADKPNMDQIIDKIEGVLSDLGFQSEQVTVLHPVLNSETKVGINQNGVFIWDRSWENDELMRLPTGIEDFHQFDLRHPRGIVPDNENDWRYPNWPEITRELGAPSPLKQQSQPTPGDKPVPTIDQKHPELKPQPKPKPVPPDPNT